MRPLLILCLLALPALAQKPADDAAVRDVVKRYVAARDAKDAKAIEALFTPDADQLVSSGALAQRPRGSRQGHAGQFRSRRRQADHHRQSVHWLSPDAAIADGRYEIAGPETRKVRRTSIVVVRRPEGWRIAAIRNMLPAPPAR